MTAFEKERKMRQQSTGYVLTFALSMTIPAMVPAQPPDPAAFKTIAVPDAVTTGGAGTRLGINPEGQIVGRYKSADGSFHGFALTEMASMQKAMWWELTPMAAARFMGF